MATVVVVSDWVVVLQDSCITALLFVTTLLVAFVGFGAGENRKTSFLDLVNFFTGLDFVSLFESCTGSLLTAGLVTFSLSSLLLTNTYLLDCEPNLNLVWL